MSKQYPHWYMTPEEFGLWSYGRAVSHETGVLYLGRDAAKQFDDTDKNAIYRISKCLLKSGWFELLREFSYNKKTGVFTAAQYRALSMEEWAEKYPGRLRTEPCPEIGNGSNPVPQSGQASASPENGTHLSRNQDAPVPISDSPVPNSGINLKAANLEKKNIEKKNQKQPAGSKSSAQSSNPVGQESENWKKRFIEAVRVIGTRTKYNVNLLPVPAWVFQSIQKHGKEAGDWMLNWLNNRSQDIRFRCKFWEWLQSDFKKQFSEVEVA